MAIKKCCDVNVLYITAFFEKTEPLMEWSE